MNTSEERKLIRFARLLSAHFNVSEESAFQLVGESSGLKRCFSPHHTYGVDEHKLSLPSLSLNYNWSRDITKSPSPAEHTEYIKLLSREVSFGKQNISLAPTTLLRNIVLSFGKLLEFQMQRTIFLVMEAFRNVDSIDSKDDDNKRKRDRIFQAFKHLSSPHVSVAKPIAASLNFSSLLQEHDQRHTELGEHEVAASFLFEVELIVLLPNNLTIPVSLKAPSQFLGKFSPECFPHLINITIDTSQLYGAMRRQCKVISKKAVNDAVGFDIFAKSKGRCVKSSSLDGSANESKQGNLSTDVSTVLTYETVSFSNSSMVQSTKSLYLEQRHDIDQGVVEQREPGSPNNSNDFEKCASKKKLGIRQLLFKKKTTGSF